MAGVLLAVYWHAAGAGLVEVVGLIPRYGSAVSLSELLNLNYLKYIFSCIIGCYLSCLG